LGEVHGGKVYCRRQNVQGGRGGGTSGGATGVVIG
jgi:hypothetical protein